MERRRQQDLTEEFKYIESGLCGQQFRQELLEQVEVGPGPAHFGEAVQEAVGAKAERPPFYFTL